MSNINVFNGIFQPQKRRTAKRKTNKPRNTGIYQLNGFKHLAFLKYEQNNLKHFGVFAGQTLTIRRFIEWNEIDSHSLYVVLLPSGVPRVCAVKTDSINKVTLHDGFGGNFVTHYRFRLDLIGIVVNAKFVREVAK